MITMNEFEFEFVNELKRLGFKKSEVVAAMKISQPTLDSRLKEPTKFKRAELSKLIDMGFKMNGIDAEIKRRLNDYLKIAK